MFTSFDRIHECDGRTDRRTDGRTSYSGIGLAYVEHCAAKTIRVHGLPDGENRTVISFDTLPACDRQKDRHAVYG